MTYGADADREWSYDVSDSAVLTLCSYVFPSVLGGVGVLVALLFGRLLVDALVSRRFEAVLLVVGVAVLSLFVRRWVVLAVAEMEFPTPLTPHSRRGLVVGSCCGALVLYGSLRIHPLGPLAVFLCSWLPLAVVSEFPTDGQLDPSERSLVVDGDDVPLDTLRAYRTLAIGSLVLCHLSYARGVPGAPRTIAVPRPAFDGVRTLLDDAVRRPVTERSTLGRAERWIVAAFGVGQLAVGPVLWVLLPADGALVALHAGAMFGILGVVMLWYAKTA